jgi:cell wall-associated NlpC family hydrolase
MKRRLFLALPLLLAGCTALPRAGAPSRITRSECIAIAERYRSHRWLPSAANVRHGVDAAGIRVDTPDVSYQKPGAVPGWWRVGEWNTGVPYQWGGFATPEEFDRGVAQGMAAGDVYTMEKRRLLDAAVSREATGIDCSGFVSRCWGLPRSYSTRELGSLCEPLPSWDALLPGDILNTYNSHVMLFAGWEDAARTRVVAYETGVPPYWLVVRRTVDRAHLEDIGFQPLRYRGMAE